MKIHTTLAVLALSATAVFGAVALQEEAGFQPARPTEHHDILKRMKGNWAATVTVMGETSEGRESNEMIGELWVRTNYRGTFMGQAFEGLGVMGYDPEKKKYVATWVDSMTTTLASGEGRYDQERNALVLKWQSKNPMTGQPTTETHTHIFVDEDHRTFTISMPGPDPKAEMEVMKIEYERK